MVWRSDAFNTTSFFTHILYHNITVTLRWGYFVTVGVTLWHHEFLGILNLPPQKKGSGKLKLLFQILAPVLAFLAPFFVMISPHLTILLKTIRNLIMQIPQGTNYVCFHLIIWFKITFYPRQLSVWSWWLVGPT